MIKKYDGERREDKERERKSIRKYSILQEIQADRKKERKLLAILDEKNPLYLSTDQRSGLGVHASYFLVMRE